MKQWCCWCDQSNTKIKEPGLELKARTESQATFSPVSMYAHFDQWDDTWKCKHCNKRNKLVKEYKSVRYVERKD